MTVFEAWPKTPRLFRDMCITEKIDGSNGCIVIQRHAAPNLAIDTSEDRYIEDLGVWVGAQSRTRVLRPTEKGGDNAGFGAWVRDNAEVLASTLGPGRHYGEWWGAGIQRGYGQTERFFSLFQAERWRWLPTTAEGVPYGPLPKDAADPAVCSAIEAGLRVVPILFQGVFSMDPICAALCDLEDYDSRVAPGQLAEGIIVWHSAARQSFKVLIENDERPKGQA